MAEDFDDDLEDGEEGGSSGGGKKKLIILIVLPLLLIIGAAAGAYFTGLLDPILGKGDTEHAEGAEAEGGDGHGGEGGEAGVGMPVFYELPEMLLNLNPGKSRRPAHLKIKVRLELASAADTPKVEAMMPRITDSFQVYLRELRVEDLQGAAGMYRLREELMMRVNRVAAPARINDVLFQEVLVQ